MLGLPARSSKVKEIFEGQGALYTYQVDALKEGVCTALIAQRPEKEAHSNRYRV
jgi:hypothetical protein